MDKLTKEQRIKNMKAVKSKGIKIEIKLMKALWQKGYRYRKNDKSVFGKPDIVFKGLKIAVFCDSEFWHREWAGLQGFFDDFLIKVSDVQAYN